MGGTFTHSKKFKKVEYLATDGKLHYELLPVDGDAINLSHLSWREMKLLTKAHGMPVEVWPEFLDYDLGIDVPLEEVLAKQEPFRTHLLQLSDYVLEQHFWLQEIAKWVRAGEYVFFCGS